jgi:hypothetical protein
LPPGQKLYNSPNLDLVNQSETASNLSIQDRLKRFKTSGDLWRDQLVLKTIEKFPLPVRSKIQFLRLSGSAQMRAEYLAEMAIIQAKFLEPVFQKQIERGKLNTERADILREAILDGELKTIVQDAVISNFVFGAFEKIALPTAGAIALYLGNPELAAVLVASISANPTAIPYYLYRTCEEVIEHNRKLSQRQVNLPERTLRLTGTVLEGLTATHMNLWPFPASMLATTSVFLLNRQRNNELFNVYVQHHAGNYIESSKKSITVF